MKRGGHETIGFLLIHLRDASGRKSRMNNEQVYQALFLANLLML
jgi:hypothetical protein